MSGKRVERGRRLPESPDEQPNIRRDNNLVRRRSTNDESLTVLQRDGDKTGAPSRWRQSCRDNRDRFGENRGRLYHAPAACTPNSRPVCPVIARLIGPARIATRRAKAGPPAHREPQPSAPPPPARLCGTALTANRETLHWSSSWFSEFAGPHASLEGNARSILLMRRC